MTSRAYSAQRAGEVMLAAIACAVVFLFLVLPVAAILEKAAHTDFFDEVTSSAVTDALRLSMVTTTMSLGLVVLFGTPLAYVMARTRFPGHAVVDTLIDLPIVLPPAVGGLGLLMVFGRRGWLGEPLDDLGVQVAFTTTAVVMAQTFVASPFYIRSARAGFEAAGQELEDVARTLGSSRSGAFLRVAVPVAMPALTAGAVMAWARALGEFGATIMFAGSIEGRTQTVPLAIYRQFETGIEAPLALSAVLVVVSFSVLLAFRLLTRRAALTL
ncbi:MAG TPA: ABC transporter permease [Dehalococcoidia bacterium]|nr:ABC transporter permease [Dehalococcoidia bacterium]